MSLSFSAGVKRSAVIKVNLSFWFPMEREGGEGEEAVRGSGRDKSQRHFFLFLDEKGRKGGFNFSLACQIAMRGECGN